MSPRVSGKVEDGRKNGKNGASIQMFAMKSYTLAKIASQIWFQTF